MVVGINIARIRKKWRMSQAEFGALIGETRNTVANYENNRSAPALEMVMRLEALVGRDIHSAEILLSDIPASPISANISEKDGDFNSIVARLERIERLLERLVYCQTLPKHDNENDV